MVYDVIEACAQPGCPLCRVSDRWAARFVAAILYEEVTDPHTRGRLKESFGFCRDHAWRTTEVGTTLLGMSIIYRGLVTQIADALADATAPDKKRWWQTLGGRAPAGAEATIPGLSAQTECPACIHLRDMEATALVAITDALPANERLAAGLSQVNGGLCLPHLRRALVVARTPDAFSFLQESAKPKLAALQADLDEFIRKYDHRFNKEEWGDERDSWQRAIAWVVGGMAE
jgi:hypothetical protein